MTAAIARASVSETTFDEKVHYHDPSHASLPEVAPRSTLTSQVLQSIESQASVEPSASSPKKTILIIGAGTAGIGSLLGILAVPEEYRQNWEIEVVDFRDNVGGVWYPQENPAPAPALPDTPLYPALHTNTVAPTMTFPGIPFPPNTPLFPPHTYLRVYHEDTVKEQNLEKYIHLSTTVLSAEWTGTQVSVRLEHEGKTEVKNYDHLVVANGHYKYPYSPTWEGQDDWVQSGDRVIEHSLWYRGPEKYKGRVVVVLGYSGSGLDVATQTVETAETVYHSFTPRDPESPLVATFPDVPGTIVKPRISHFTSKEIVFLDGTTIPSDHVTIILCTGYTLLAPFLRDLHEGPITKTTTTLTTNGDYIRPLHHSIFALDSRLPRDALSFISLPWYIGNGPNTYIQGLFLGHSFASVDGEFLPTNEVGIKELIEREEAKRAEGFEPFDIGDQFTAFGQGEAYQDNLFDIIRTRSKIPLPAYLQGKEKYVEEWRHFGRGKGVLLRKAWRRAIYQGVEQEFLPEVRTEEAWAEVLYKIVEWYTKETERELAEKEETEKVKQVELEKKVEKLELEEKVVQL